MSWCSRATIKAYTGYKMAQGTDKIECVGWQIIPSIWKVQVKQENSNCKEYESDICYRVLLIYWGKKFKVENDQKSKQWMKEDFLNSVQNILLSKVGEQKKLQHDKHF